MGGSVSPILWATPIEYLIVVGMETVAATVAIVGVGLLYLRRRSLPYFFVLVAISTLLVRSLIGLSSILYPVTFDRGGFTLYNTVEHGLDVVLVGALLVAVYFAREGLRVDGEDR